MKKDYQLIEILVLICWEAVIVALVYSVIILAFSNIESDVIGEPALKDSKRIDLTGEYEYVEPVRKDGKAYVYFTMKLED